MGINHATYFLQFDVKSILQKGLSPEEGNLDDEDLKKGEIIMQKLQTVGIVVGTERKRVIRELTRYLYFEHSYTDKVPMGEFPTHASVFRQRTG